MENGFVFYKSKAFYMMLVNIISAALTSLFHNGFMKIYHDVFSSNELTNIVSRLQALEGYIETRCMIASYLVLAVSTVFLVLFVLQEYRKMKSRKVFLCLLPLFTTFIPLFYYVNVLEVLYLLVVIKWL